MRPALRVLQPGILTTVQDLGRPKSQHFGIPVGGAMDRFALVVANRLVGNEVNAAALEITGAGASFELLTPLLLSLTGADVEIMLDDQFMPSWTAILARQGQKLRIGNAHRSGGGRTYIAIHGGVDVPEVLGSRSTNLNAGFGGLQGRALRTGDVLRTADLQLEGLPVAGRSWPSWARPRYAPQPTLRVLPGPHLDYFAESAWTTLLAETWQIGQQSNRIGYRLQGPALHYAQATSIPSHGVIPGAVQVPPDGKPILLMADAQATGGYPIIAVVVEADLPLAAQLLPGDCLSFADTTIDEAVVLRKLHDDWLRTALVKDEVVQQLAWASAFDAVSLTDPFRPVGGPNTHLGQI